MKDLIVSAKHEQHGQSGQSLVELAISLGVILLLLAGAIDFGMGFYSFVALQDAAQEGALYASFSPYDDANGNGKYEPDLGEGANRDGVIQRIRASSHVPIDFSDTTKLPDANIDVVATTGDACEGMGTDLETGLPASNGIRVTIHYDYHIIMPFAGTVLGGQTIPLTATVTDTILEPRCPTSP